LRQSGIKHAQSGSEQATVGLGEKHGHVATQSGELIPLRACHLEINPLGRSWRRS
jgi:hypothetical protein